MHGGVLAGGHGLEVGATGPADGAGYVKEGDGGNDEFTGVAPAAVHDQVGQAIGAAECLAVHLEAALGLGRGGGAGPLLKASVFGARREAADVGVGHRREAENQEG